MDQAPAPSTETASASGASARSVRAASIRPSTHVAHRGNNRSSRGAKHREVNGKNPYLSALGPDPDHPSWCDLRVANERSHESGVPELDPPIRLAPPCPYDEQGGPAPRQ